MTITTEVRMYRNGNTDETREFSQVADAVSYVLAANEAGLERIDAAERDGEVVFDFGWFSIHVAGTTLDGMRDAYRKERAPKCRKCDGDGTIEVYDHVVHGLCFRCGGTGREPQTEEEKRAAEVAVAKARGCYVAPVEWTREDELEAEAEAAAIREGREYEVRWF